jgi:hypothetical protein
VPGVGSLFVRLAFRSDSAVSVRPLEIGAAYFGTLYGYCFIFSPNAIR